MFIPNFIVSLCRSFTAFHLGSFPSSSGDGGASLSAIEDSAKEPEGDRYRHTQGEATTVPSSSSSSSSTNPSSASESSSANSSTGASDTGLSTPVMAYPLSDMRNDISSPVSHTPFIGSVPSTAGLSASDYTPDDTYHHHSQARDDDNDDVCMGITEPCNTSTPVRPKTPRSFMDNSMTDTSSSTISPLSDSTNITTPSTTNGSVFKSGKAKRPSRGFYPLPTYCPFFSSPDLENAERTRELWKHRLEQARRRASAFPSGIAGVAREVELKGKAGYIKRMDWIEGFKWELPSEFEQYMFLVKLQAEEDEREARREEERALRAGEESSDSDGNSSDSASSSDFGDGEGSSRGQTSDRGSEGDRSEDLEPPSSRDIADFGRAREFDEMKMRLEELHRNAKAFSNFPLFEEAGIFDEDEDDDIVDANGRHGAQGIDYI